MKAQIADVNKVLGSVYQMCKAGNKVIFDIDQNDPKRGGYIENERNGSRTFMEVNQITGEFQFDLWVQTTAKPERAIIPTSNRYGALQAIDGAPETQELGFHRQAEDPL